MNKRRVLTTLICALLGLMLLMYAGHAAHPGHGHVHQDCAVCRVMDGWFSLLRRVAALWPRFGFAFAAALLFLALAAFAAVPRQGITPVTLKVKITS